MYRDVEPIRHEEAFSDDSEAGQLSRCAFLLASSLLMTGDGDRLDTDEAFPLPSEETLLSGEPVPYEQAIAELDIDPATHMAEQIPQMARDLGPGLAARAATDAVAALALIEVSQHSDVLLVRTAAAAAGVIASGERDDLVATLVEGIGSDDELTRDIAATALANVDANHESLQKLAGDDEQLEDQGEPSNTTFLTHGTWAAGADWYRPGPPADFYDYLAALPELMPLKDPSFTWSGAYNHARRVNAAVQMDAYVRNGFGDTPDLVAHSHGGTVAHLATQIGLDLDRLVLLSWPVHRAWYPAFARIQRIISFRVRFDLVIMADRGGQHFRHPNVDEHVHGWFDHGDTHEENYWRKHDLKRHL